MQNTLENHLHGGAITFIREPQPCNTTFGGSRGPILTITGDGRLERGESFATNDEASIAFFDCLAKNLPTYLSALRQRAENAERKLAELIAGS